jgi:hypothetical protein
LCNCARFLTCALGYNLGCVSKRFPGEKFDAARSSSALVRLCYQKLIIPEVIVANLPEKRTAAVWRSVPPIDGISGNFYHCRC